jgi:hypothetical protein
MSLVERPNVRQDEFGRATHFYQAVIDSRKDLDRRNDNHGSKIVALPMVPERRLEISAVLVSVLTAASRTVRKKVRAFAAWILQSGCSKEMRVFTT